jgi:hypothetical protein
MKRLNFNQSVSGTQFYTGENWQTHTNTKFDLVKSSVMGWSVDQFILKEHNFILKKKQKQHYFK